MPAKPPANTVYDGFLSLDGGVNSGWLPNLIPNNTLSFAWNCTVRGGFVTHRPGRKRLTLDFGTDSLGAQRFLYGRYQGSEIYRPDVGDPHIVASVSGRLFKVQPGDDTATVSEITIKHQTLTTADFVVPVVGATVDVTVESIANINPNVTVVVGGYSFTVSAASGSTLTLENVDAPVGDTIGTGSTVIFYDVNPALRRQAWMVQAEKWMIIQDGQSVPIFWDNAQARRSEQTLQQISAGKMMAYHLGRVAKVNPDGVTFSIGDIVYGSSGTAAQSQRDAVLYVKENTFLAGGGNFTVPGNFGEITFMRGVAVLDASLGQGPLQVGAEKAIFSCNLPVDRTTWQSVENPILTVSQINNGGAAQDAAVLVNGDLFYRSLDGTIRSLILGIREFQTSWGNVPVSREMNRILPYDDRTLLKYGSGVAFDGRLLMTTSPVFSNRGTYSRGMVALDFDVLSSMRDKRPACWDGLWLGNNTLKLHTGTFDGKERCFELSLTGTGQIELWEITTDEYKDKGNVPIYWTFETASMFRQGQNFNELDLKWLYNGEVFVEDVKGRVDFWVWWKTDQHGCWNAWKHWYVCADETQCYQDDAGCLTDKQLQPQYRRRMTLGQPPDVCDPVDGKELRKGNTFQVKVAIMGHCRFKGIRLAATLCREELFGDQTETCLDSTCDAVVEATTEYKNSAQSYTATCPDATPVGDPVSVTIEPGVYVSTVSQAAADALALAAAQAKAEAALSCAVTYDVTVTVAAGAVGSDLTDFPLMIRLSDMPSGFWTYVAADGGDIRAYTGGGTQLCIDMAWIDTSSQDGVIFVKTTLTSATDTDVVIKCGNGLTALAPTATYGRNNVWIDYEFVCLFRNDTVDRTGNHTLSKDYGTATYDTATLGNLGLGGGLTGDGSTKWRSTGFAAATTFSLLYTMEQTSNPGPSSLAPCSYSATATITHRAMIYASVGGTWTGYDGQNGATSLTDPVVLSTARRCAGVWQAATSREFYLDGVSKATDAPITADGSVNNALAFLSASLTAAGNELIGTIGFFQFRYGALSDDWVAADYANIHDTSTFYSVTGP